jgi:hypothetical protein
MGFLQDSPNRSAIPNRDLPKRDRFILAGFIWENTKAAARELLSLAAAF